MPVKKGERIDPEATRRRVLDAATGLFYERGTHPVGVNEIAEAAGVSKLTLYRHFDSKDGLIRAFLERHSEQALARLELAARCTDLTPRERILLIFDGLASEFCDPRYRGCALINTAAEWRGTDADPREIARVHVGRVRDLFARLCTEAGLRDAEHVADQLTLLLEGAITVRMASAADDPASVARAAADALLSQAAAVR